VIVQGFALNNHCNACLFLLLLVSLGTNIFSESGFASRCLHTGRLPDGRTNSAIPVPRTTPKV
jgi:hypothetical protein